jgi:hypothetical protein
MLQEIEVRLGIACRKARAQPLPVTTSGIGAKQQLVKIEPCRLDTLLMIIGKRRK